MTHRYWLIFVIAAGLVLTGCAGNGSAVRASKCKEDGCRKEAYRIGPSDVLDISVWKDKHLDRTVTVRPDGMISLPLLNDVHASGLTPMQLRKALTKALKEYMPAPEVSVIVKKVNSYKVSVLGEVRHPGRYVFKMSATVLDALAQAGGFTSFASPSDIVILRKDGRDRRHINFDYSDAVASGDNSKDLSIDPGDIIVVP